MRNVSDTVARLARMRSLASQPGHSTATDRLGELDDFGSNPGNLRARTYVPDDLPERPALVVVLHGCTQSAAAYDTGSGWSRLADRRGLILLFPEQRRENNANLCFNWFAAGDTRRGGGEALSIRQMVAAMIRRHGIDPARVFVTGLSAGGAMTAVMLATYPDVFAGGAIIAGLPYGCATSIPEAFDRMRGHGVAGEQALGELVRRASRHDGPWPTVSIWHGGADATVSASNADAIVAQWRAVHGVPAAPSLTDEVDGHPHRVWRDAGNRAVIEDYRIAGLGHGTPLDTIGDDPCGVAGPFMLEARISSTRHIAAFWGLIEVGASDRPEPALAAAPRLIRLPEPPAPAAPANGVERIIQDALRSAGLLR